MHIYNKLVIIIGFGIFRFENANDLFAFFKNLVGANGNQLISGVVPAIKPYIFIFLISLLACFPIVPYFKKRFEASKPSIYSLSLVCVTAFVLILMFVNTAVLVKTFGSNNPFLYWNF